jgi:hypothetical protein
MNWKRVRRERENNGEMNWSWMNLLRFSEEVWRRFEVELDGEVEVEVELEDEVKGSPEIALNVEGA